LRSKRRGPPSQKTETLGEKQKDDDKPREKDISHTWECRKESSTVKNPGIKKIGREILDGFSKDQLVTVGNQGRTKKRSLRQPVTVLGSRLKELRREGFIDGHGLTKSGTNWKTGKKSRHISHGLKKGKWPVK